MQGHEQIGPQRYRESFGRYYDDFNVGDVYEHRPGRTITESRQYLVHAADDEHPSRCTSTRSMRPSPSSSSRWSIAA